MLICFFNWIWDCKNNFRIFREPDVQIGYFLNIFSMGTILSFIMIIAGIFMLNNLKRKNEI